MSAIASQDTEDYTENPETLTLLDLYQALDWSGVEQAEKEWLETNEQVSDLSEKYTAELDFKAKFRMVLLDEALHSEDMSRMVAAKQWLKRAGVWSQVKNFYFVRGLLPISNESERPANPDETESIA